jgi:hypothetical protein
MEPVPLNKTACCLQQNNDTASTGPNADMRKCAKSSQRLLCAVTHENLVGFVATRKQTHTHSTNTVYHLRPIDHTITCV